MPIINSLLVKRGDDTVEKDHYVNFLDYDGLVLENGWYDEGENATAPSNPDRTDEGLTFTSWNMTYNSLSAHRNVSALYETTDGKTHVFFDIGLANNTGSGLKITLYMNKSDTSTMTFDWGDGSDNVEVTDSGDFTVEHTFNSVGEFEVSMWISTGSGTYTFGQGTEETSFVGGNSQVDRETLKRLFIGQDTLTIPAYAFYAHYNLEAVTLNDATTNIGNYAFAYCRSLTNLSIPNTITSLGNNVFRATQSIVHMGVPESITSIPESFLRASDGLETISISTQATIIGEYAFSFCNSLYRINLSNQLVTLSNDCFNSCAFEKIELPNSLITIEGNAFKECWKLEEITFSTSLTTINYQAFQSCVALYEIELPNTVSYIGYDAFKYCSNILSYTILSIVPPTLQDDTFGNYDSFEDITVSGKIYVPDESYNDYQTATGWSEYFDYLYPTSGDVILSYGTPNAGLLQIKNVESATVVQDGSTLTID